MILEVYVRLDFENLFVSYINHRSLLVFEVDMQATWSFDHNFKVVQASKVNNNFMLNMG